MSEPIKWSGDGWATVDGISVRCDRIRVLEQAPVWIVMNGYEPDAPVVVEHLHDRDLAARAVVAAVRVLRGEADAAVAAERERCVVWKNRLFFGCGCCISTKQSRINSEALDAIESGAPAPREG